MTARQLRLDARYRLIDAGRRLGLSEREMAVALDLTPARVHAMLQDLDDLPASRSERARNFQPHSGPTVPTRRRLKK